MSEDEQMMEAACEEERYLELHTDITQKALYEEEELKRLNEAIADGYSAVGFNYDQYSNLQYAQEAETAKVEEEEEEPFYAPPELQLPADIIPPATIKQNAIIEKTALFISKHSTQMEIMIKTKQRGNSQFEFLDFGDVLNPYYKHMIKMLKSGKYHPRGERTERQNSEENYLHPSLTKTTESQPVIKELTREEFMNSVSSGVPRGQIANTPYAKLLSNLSKHTARNSHQPQRAQPATVSKTYAGAEPQVTGTTTVIDQGQMPVGYSQTEHPEGYDPPHGYAYGGGPSSLGQPPVPGMEPVHLPEAHTNGQPPPPGAAAQEAMAEAESPPGEDPDYYGAEPVHGPQVVPPPPDIQPVIDKMAIYVAKNGPEFEIIVCRKNDERFEFLKEGHPHNAYYRHKKEQYKQTFAEAKKATETVSTVLSKHGNAEEDKASQQTISFSLKSKEADVLSSGLRATALRATALLYESSDGDSDDEDELDKRLVAPSGDSIMNQYDTKLSMTTEELERKQAEVRLKDKLSMAAREKLAQTSKEDQLKAERKRKAAMFINMLKSTQQPAGGLPEKQDASVCAAEMSVSGNASPANSDSPDPYDLTGLSSHDKPQSRHSPDVTAPSNHHRPWSRASSPVVLRKSHSPSIPRSKRSRSRSLRRRSRSPRKRSRTRSPRRRSRSLRRRSRSPWKRSKSPRRRKRSRTPPSAYTVVRRSVSPRRRRSRSRSITPARYKRPQTSRSKPKIIDHKDKASKSRSKRSTSRSRGKSPSRSRKRSRSRSKRKSRSRSRTRKRSRSKTRKRSRSHDRSKSSKSKSKKKTRPNSRSPKQKKSHDSRKEDKKEKKSSKSSSKSKDRSESKRSKDRKSVKSDRKKASSPPEESIVILDHEEDEASVHREVQIDSDTTSESSAGSPQRAAHDKPDEMVCTQIESTGGAVVVLQDSHSPEMQSPHDGETSSHRDADFPESLDSSEDDLICETGPSVTGPLAMQSSPELTPSTTPPSPEITPPSPGINKHSQPIAEIDTKPSKIETNNTMIDMFAD